LQDLAKVMTVTSSAGLGCRILDGEAVHQVERIRGLVVVPDTVTVYLPEVAPAVLERIRGFGIPVGRLEQKRSTDFQTR